MMADNKVIQDLKRAAAVAARHSYSPYSHLQVGAALLADDEEIISACNVENASYGLSMCAERSAVFQAVARGKRKVRAIAIFADSEKPALPCGACRQVLIEFGRDAEVFVFSSDGGMIHTRLDRLLPLPFESPAAREPSGSGR